MILANNFAEVLKAFNAFDVEYMIAGGYAVIFHGYVRTTGDLDIWLKPGQENQKKIIKAFRSQNFSSELISHLEGLDFNKAFAVKLGEEPLQVDLFNKISGITYSDAEERSIPYSFSDGLKVRFLHLDDLIANKMLTGRLKDKADVEELQKIRKYHDDK